MVRSSGSSGHDELLHVATIKESSTLLGDMDAGRATILPREKFTDYGVLYESRSCIASAKTLKMQRDSEGT